MDPNVEEIGLAALAAKLRGSFEHSPPSGKVFGQSDLDAAVAWLASPITTGIEHRFVPKKGVLVVEPTGPLHAEDFDALGAVVDPWIESPSKPR